MKKPARILCGTCGHAHPGGFGGSLCCTKNGRTYPKNVFYHDTCDKWKRYRPCYKQEED